MAGYLGVHRNTVSGYLNRRIRPNKRTLSLWALRTGAPYEWLVNGDDQPQQPPPDSDPGPAEPAPEQLPPVAVLRRPVQAPAADSEPLRDQFAGLVSFLPERARRYSKPQPSDPKVISISRVIPILRRAC